MLLCCAELAGFSGVLVLAFLALPNSLILKHYMGVSSRLMAARDCRVRLVSEMISGIQIMKFCSWERVASEQVLTHRASVHIHGCIEW